MQRFFTVLASVLGILSLLAVPVYAAVSSNDNIVIRQDETIDDDFFAMGEEITIEGTINGDLYALAQRLNVRGQVNGDVITAANTIVISGQIRDDLRAVGSSISLIGAEIGDSLSVGSNDLSIDSQSQIGGGLIFGGRTITIAGSVGRGITGGGENTRIDADVARTVLVSATKLTIDQNAVVEGDLKYSSQQQAIINGRVMGEVVQKQDQISFDSANFVRGLVVGFTVWAFLGALIVAGLLAILLPKTLMRSRDKLLKNPWRVFGLGSVALLAAIPLVILLVVTVIGIPLAVIILVTWLLAIYMAKFFVAFAVGSRLLSSITSGNKDRYLLALLIGLSLYYLLRLIPGVGILIRLATTVIGIGMMLSLFKRQTSRS